MKTIAEFIRHICAEDIEFEKLSEVIKSYENWGAGNGALHLFNLKGKSFSFSSEEITYTIGHGEVVKIKKSAIRGKIHIHGNKSTMATISINLGDGGYCILNGFGYEKTEKPTEYDVMYETRPSNRPDAEAWCW